MDTQFIVIIISKFANSTVRMNLVQPAAKGAFSTRESFADMKLVWFKNPVETQYIRIVALSEIKGDEFASAAEIGVIPE